MNNVPKLNLYGHVEAAKMNDGFQIQNTLPTEKTGGVSFKGMLSSMAQEVNASIEKPDALLADLVQGKPNVDVHDVMLAMAKAEVGVSIATQLTTKVINAYDRISQIQI